MYAEKVAELLTSAKTEVVIISAFIRGETLSWLLSHIDPNLKSIKIYARWRASDLAVGASDNSVIGIAQERGAIFRVHDDLHAKIYIADGEALVGSANATNAGLGHNSSYHKKNLEILVRCSAHDNNIVNVVKILNDKSTEPYYLSEKMIESLRQITERVQIFEPEIEDNWFPVSSPTDIQDNPELALKDCLELGVCPGVDKKRLCEIFIDRRVYKELKDILSNPLTCYLSNEKGAQLLSKLFPLSDEEIMNRWHVLCDWAQEFPQEMYVYKGENSPEIWDAETLMNSTKNSIKGI